MFSSTVRIAISDSLAEMDVSIRVTWGIRNGGCTFTCTCAMQ